MADVGELGVDRRGGGPATRGPGSREDHQAATVVHPRGTAARHAAGGAGPDDCVDGAADHRGRPARRVPPGLGRHGLPPRLDGVDTPVGQVGRPVRAKDLLPGVDRDLRHRLGTVRFQPHHDRAHRLPGPAGPRRRRAHGGCADDHRRCRLASRARPLHGSLRGHVRGGHGHRAADRRPVRDLPVRGAGSSTSTCPSASWPCS